MGYIGWLNGGAVGLYGMILSAAFCDIQWTRKKRMIMAGSMAAFLLLQGIFYGSFSTIVVEKLYPVITHLPLMVVLSLISKKRLWSVVSVLMAYLCCQLRRWLALLIVALNSGDAVMQAWAEFAITVPLTLFLLYFVAPSIRIISNYPSAMQGQFGLIPVLSYVFDYVCCVYTDMFSEGGPVVVEFMFFVCSVAYLMSMLHTSKEEKRRIQLEHTQNYLELQVAQAIHEIEHMRESQQNAKIYRHDLRHHMLHLLNCIESGRSDYAKEYINTICAEIEAYKVRTFCENEAANLLFSTFIGQAEKLGIEMEIKAEISKSIHISENDLCALLSNALENALYSCQKKKEKGFGVFIRVTAFEKNKKLWIQIINSCEEDIVFDKGIPVSTRSGHGIGVRSICALVEKYNGIYEFAVKDDCFILQISL